VLEIINNKRLERVDFIENFNILLSISSADNVLRKVFV